MLNLYKGGTRGKNTTRIDQKKCVPGAWRTSIYVIFASIGVGGSLHGIIDCSMHGLHCSFFLYLDGERGEVRYLVSIMNDMIVIMSD